jgi:excisionase family DNA binding protein
LAYLWEGGDVQTVKIGLGVEPQFFGVEDAARYAGVSSQTIRRMLREQRLTAFRPNRAKIVVSREELDRLIRRSAESEA